MPIKTGTYIKPKIAVKKPRGFVLEQIDIDITKCPYCGSEVNYHETSTFIYKTNYGGVYACSKFPKCDAYVGELKFSGGEGKPSGTLANKPLRMLRKKLRAMLEEIFNLNKALNITDPVIATYVWLAAELRVERKNCLVGNFTIELAIKAMPIVTAFIHENFEFDKAAEILAGIK